MKTKIQLINDCFAELRISGITTQPDSKDVALALYRLEDYISQLPFDINFNFEATPNPNTISGIPPFANLAIAQGLALNLCPLYGKAPELLIRQASASMSILQGRIATPKRVAYPSRQPLGMGNRNYLPGYFFMPESVVAPTSPQTEQMNVGDIKKFTIDFSSELPFSTTITVYSNTQSGGLIVSAITQTLMKLSFTVQATADGFQQIVFTITANNGEKVKRVLDFNILDETALRANP